MDRSDTKHIAKSTLASRIERAAKGLNFVSETDAPVLPFFAEGDIDSLLSAFKNAAASPPETTIEEIDANEFFDRLTRKRDWHTAAQKKNAANFKRLQKLLEDELLDLKVFRVGKVKLKIYVVGRDADGNLAGVVTEAIET